MTHPKHLIVPKIGQDHTQSTCRWVVPHELRDNRTEVFADTAELESDRQILPGSEKTKNLSGELLYEDDTGACVHGVEMGSQRASSFAGPGYL